MGTGFTGWPGDKKERTMTKKSIKPVKTQTAAAAAGFGKKGLCYNKT
jgi:hypothetical protein